MPITMMLLGLVALIIIVGFIVAGIRSENR